MSIIPSDILASAADAAKEWEMEAGAHRMLVATIAAAIAEERKRCAGVARGYGKACMPDRSAGRVAQFIAEAIEA